MAITSMLAAMMFSRVSIESGLISGTISSIAVPSTVLATSAPVIETMHIRSGRTHSRSRIRLSRNLKRSPTRFSSGLNGRMTVPSPPIWGSEYQPVPSARGVWEPHQQGSLRPIFRFGIHPSFSTSATPGRKTEKARSSRVPRAKPKARNRMVARLAQMKK